MITALIADDEPDVRALLRLIISSDDGIDICAEAKDGLDAVEQWRRTRPDIVILDQRMPRLTGLEAAAQIKQEDPGQAVMLLSAYLDEAEITRAGALGLPVMSKRDIMQVPDFARGLAVRS